MDGIEEIQKVELVNIYDLPQPADYHLALTEILSQIITLGNVVIGLIIGYIAVRGFFDSWNTSD